MSRGGRIGGGNRRHRKPFGLPMRPTRWISGSDATNGDLDPNGCVVTTHPIRCNSAEGPTGFELVQGTSDLEVIDRQDVTVTRVVGQISLRYSQLVDMNSPSFSVPCVRAGLIAVDGTEDVGTWVPPDLFDDAELEESRFMWLRQSYMDRLDWATFLVFPALGIAQGAHVSSSVTWDLDVSVNRKIGRDGHLMLVVQKHFDAVGVAPPDPTMAPFVSFTKFLRVLIKC